MNQLDVIGDVHGRLRPLEELLTHLGYAPLAGIWRHPGGRKAVFLGDLVDRGPDISEVLALVKAMVDAGEAWVVLGNHEYGLLGWYTQNADGAYRRNRRKKYLKFMGPSVALFDHFPEEHQVYLEWFATLPLALEIGGARFVHAYWDTAALRVIPPGAGLNDIGWREPTFPNDIKRLVDLLVKGPEVALPDGYVVVDRQNIAHRHARMYWWLIHRASDLRELVKPDTPALSGLPIPDYARAFGPPAPDEAPLFFGHFGFAECPGRLGANYTCVDFTGAHGKTIGAYRWFGEATLRDDHLVR
ncbi:MAG TPA: metallophosphoesterase [Kiritimatiellia bacterium]|nr:metallophosphoesterase [Kiritimatiellia bacterium]HMO98244.1 metallophosphoesterase [Kiritimatiellia bacterium]HMP96589.1 metallophosphoesterase [Kiritimatiellia bacterium]